MSFTILVIAATLPTLLVYACCRVSGRVSEWERERDAEVEYLEWMWKQ